MIPLLLIAAVWGIDLITNWQLAILENNHDDPRCAAHCFHSTHFSLAQLAERFNLVAGNNWDIFSVDNVCCYIVPRAND